MESIDDVMNMVAKYLRAASSQAIKLKFVRIKLEKSAVCNLQTKIRFLEKVT